MEYGGGLAAVTRSLGTSGDPIGWLRTHGRAAR
jgi:hypothetical protein